MMKATFRSTLQSPTGYYLTADAGVFYEDGYLQVLTRIDDVINTAGIRISTGRIEEVVGDHKSVAECAVVGSNDVFKGVVPITLIVLQGTHDSSKVSKEVQQLVYAKVGVFAKIEKVVFVKRQPNTKSGKILRNLLRDISNNVPNPRVAGIIQDRSVVEELVNTFIDSELHD